MKNKEVKVDGLYRARVSGNLVTIKILSEHRLGGWNALNTSTGRKIRIKSGRRIQGVATTDPIRQQRLDNKVTTSAEDASRPVSRPKAREGTRSGKARESAVEGTRGTLMRDNARTSTGEGLASRISTSNTEGCDRLASKLSGRRRKAGDVDDSSTNRGDRSQRSLKDTTSRGEAEKLDNIVVIALAGTGKSFSIVVGLAYVFLKERNDGSWEKFVDRLGFEPIPSDEQLAIWKELEKSKGARTVTYAAFNKSIVNEFSETWGWLVDMLREVGVTLNFATTNSLGHKACMEAFGRVKVSTWKTRNLMESILGVDIRELEKNDFGFIRAVEVLVGMCKLTLAGWTSSASYDDPSEEEMDQIVQHHDIDLNGG